MNFKKPLIRCENFIPFVQLLNIYANIFPCIGGNFAFNGLLM